MATTVSTSFPDSTYSTSNKPVTTTVKADISAIETAINTHNAATTGEHGVAGTFVGTSDAQTLTNKTLTSPVLDTGISGTAFLDEDNMASNSATKIASQQSIKAYVDSGTVTMTNKTLTKPTIDGHVTGYATYTPAGGATATLDCAADNRHSITMPAGNITIALSNITVGQIIIVEITQDSGGSRTVTWFSTIRWAGGSAPTLTTTANKRDVFGFICTGSGTYDGYVIAFNI